MKLSRRFIKLDPEYMRKWCKDRVLNEYVRDRYGSSWPQSHRISYMIDVLLNQLAQKRLEILLQDPDT